jgi:hypothetical protein
MLHATVRCAAIERLTVGNATRIPFQVSTNYKCRFVPSPQGLNESSLLTLRQITCGRLWATSECPKHFVVPRISPSSSGPFNHLLVREWRSTENNWRNTLSERWSFIAV